MGPQHHRHRSHQSESSASSANSYASDHSRSTAPTVLSDRPPLLHCNTVPAQFGRCAPEPLVYVDKDEPRASVETYASTVPSADDIPEEPEYEVPFQHYTVFPSDATASTPPEFAELFPSTRRFLIHHDDSTSDGNMNLRVDTEISTSEDCCHKVTLFHLRMQDLKDRRFSLRRYCRDSGREVCHSTRKYAVEPMLKPKRPALQRSLSSALQSLGIKSRAWTPPKRQEFKDIFSGLEVDDGFKASNLHVEDSHYSAKGLVATDTVQLEFSNYAHVQLRRQRTRTTKFYTYEYWGIQYQWERFVHRHGQSKIVSYHLFYSATSTSIAHIEPDPLSRWEEMEEKHKGGWVPPCSLFITDEIVIGGSTDVADVIMATGLTALVDDCIHRNWHNKRSVQLRIPKKGTAAYIGPERLIDQVFNR